MGQTISYVLDFVGLGESLIAFRTADVSTSNGSSFEGESALPCGLAIFLGLEVFFSLLLACFPPVGGEGEAGAFGLEPAGFGFPDIEAPQNGQSSTSSSRTEASQAGHFRKSITVVSS